MQWHKQSTINENCTDVIGLVLYFFDATAPVGQGLLIHEVSKSYKKAHHSR